MRLHHLIFASLVATSAESPVIGVASVIDGDTLEIHDQRIYIITARRITSGELLKHRKGFCIR